MDEEKQIVVAKAKAILRFDIPFSYQEKERLVYCHLFEHAILHKLIAIQDVDKI